MVRSFRRGAVAAVLALSLAPLAACAAGNQAQTLNVHPDNPETSKGPIQVQNAIVLTQPNGPATVTARLYNNGSSAQTLDSVQLAGGQSATLSAANGGGSVTVPAHGTVLLGGKGNPSAVVTSGAEALRDGDVQNAVFVFSGTGAVALPVNVLPATGFYQPYGPGSLPATPAPSPTATPATPTAKPGSAPSSSSTPSTPSTPATPTTGATPTGGMPTTGTTTGSPTPQQ